MDSRRLRWFFAVLLTGLVGIMPASLGSVADGVLLDLGLPSGYLAETLYSPSLQAPIHVAVSPVSGAVVVTDWGVSERVIQIHEEGALTTYAQPSSGKQFGIVFDVQGTLYVNDDAGRLWAVAPDGSVELRAEGVWGWQLDVGPAGDIFVVGGDDHTMQRVTPTGVVSTYATGFQSACDVAVSPVIGKVMVMDRGAGAIVEVKPNGSHVTLVDGLMTDWSYIAFAPDGTLYHLSINEGLVAVSTEDGARTPVPWMKACWANFSPKDFAFDAQGRLVTVDCTYNHVARFDLETETMQVLWQGMGNTRALATAPDGTIHLGVSNPRLQGSGAVAALDAEGDPVIVFEGLLPEVEGLTFDTDGTAYVVATGEVSGTVRSRVYAATPTGITETLALLPTTGFDLAFDPLSGMLWGGAPHGLWVLDEFGGVQEVALDTGEGFVESLTFTPPGELYVHMVTSDLWSKPVTQGLYHVATSAPYTTTLVADLSTVDMCCTLNRIGAGADGAIYVVGFGDRYTPGHEPGMRMLRVTPSGAVSLFAYPLGMDPTAVTAGMESDLLFSSGCGVVRIFEAEQVFLPLILRSTD